MSVISLPNGVDFEYSVDGCGTPIVLLPGLGNRREVWAEIAEEFAGQYCVYSCDLRSYCESRVGKPLAISELADDVALFMDELNISGAIVIGHSLGGFVALELALARQERLSALILASSASYTDEYGRTLLRMWRALAEQGNSRLLIDELFLWNFSPYFSNERTREMRILKSMTQRENFDLPTFSMLALACESHETRDRLAAIRLPTLLLGGIDDIVMTLRHNRLLNQLIPHSELITLPNAGHNLIAEAADAMIEPMHHFLTRCKLTGAL